MLYSKNDSQLYVQEFKKRFTNFCEKAPLLLSFTTSPTMVTVVDETTNKVMDFEFDYAIPVKSFIHGIKQKMISEHCYPVMRVVKEEVRDVPREEQLRMITEGRNIDEVPTKYTAQTIIHFLIDKVIIFKDQFVIRDLESEKLYLYKMNKSSAFFLQKIRRHKLNAETSAEYFFANSTLLNEIEPKPMEMGDE